MDLEDHSRVGRLFAQGTVNPYHRKLYDVGGAALDGGVDGVAFGQRAEVGVLRVDVWQVAAAAEDGLDIAVGPRGGDARVDEFAYAREGGEVVVDDLLCLAARTGAV